MSSYLTQPEVDAMQTSSLSRETPFLICSVSASMFSVARYYGGVKYNGEHFVYLAEHDELIRDDVLAWVTKRRKGERKAKRKAVVARPELFE